ncbi:FecR family protein [Mucilaginibacter lappiensis]|uniref:Ferric-dicitrate binding protein FerR (Iron transport regulator) n=1 Tax=Mucilaginibacter lappiensis TaxID=354630 RepID=A0ABR6PHG3_9SPHI|nr:FecR family protein [Mucilaginibacter lappiensis]MBB6109203.1 ferric-dicitrate binding protein FerR (iron transport regulator) [Mucilaginibacter lappiensis]SIQ79893.1 FecR family protein [Mucilaginibacter lappiensis]
MNIEDFKKLLHRYNAGKCTEAEKTLLESWYSEFEFQKLPELTNDQLAEILSIQTALPQRKIKSLIPWISSAAAVLLLCLSVGGYFLWHKHYLPQAAEKYTYNVPPGSDKAILTLANGKKMVLSANQVGKLAEQGGVAVDRTADGKVLYTASEKQDPTVAMLYNTLSTPRGGQYSLVLADGTKVWLNAASSIKYPVAFNGDERKVEITGEAYFEVVHNAAKPFRIVAGNQVIEDLGTQFNVNSYVDEPLTKVTLIAGSVKISGNKENIILKPGQQSQFPSQPTSQGFRITDNADVAEAVAWKNGLFKFHKASLQTVMRQLSRWYNVNVNYEGKIPDVEFSGEITRNVNMSEVLDILSYLKVHFKMKQNNQDTTITVTE